MAQGKYKNISSAATTEIKDTKGVLERVTINKAVNNAVITIHDNVAVALTADADGIATSQTPLAAGDLTLDGALASGGVATLGNEQVVTITCAADETARTFTVTGTNTSGATITEEISGVSATVATGSTFFKTVTQIAVDAATTGAVTAGVPAVTSTIIATITMPATVQADHVTLEYDLGFAHGLTVVTDSATDLTVTYT